MHAYIIEDDPLKCSRIAQFLQDRFPSIVVDTFGSFHSGLRAIESNTPGLVLLDMTLPTFDRELGARAGRFRPLGGYELLSKLKLRSVQTSVIVVTGLISFGEGNQRISFEEVRNKCAQEFSDVFRGMVYFQQSDPDWCNSLALLIGETLEGARDA